MARGAGAQAAEGARPSTARSPQPRVIGGAAQLHPLDPVKALFWSAVMNGVVAVPVMVMMLLMAVRRDVMGPFAIGPVLKVLGWLATAAMSAAIIGMLATWSS